MKKICFKLCAVSLALCVFFGACNFNINGGKELAEVRVGGGGGRAANRETGLPIFDGSNTTITISDASGRLIAEGAFPFSAEVVVGIEIVVKATVRTASGTWTRTKTHTVKGGINDIDLELSKTPNVAANLLVSITGKHHSGSNIVSLSTQNGKKLLDGILIGKKPIAARDKIGRIYVLYEDTSSPPHLNLKRFDVEGNEDAGFEAALAAKLSPLLPNGISDIDNIAIDQDDNYIFLFKENTVYCFKEKEDHSFESFESDDFPSLSPPVPSSSAVAVYDDVLFAVYNDTLFACKFEFEDASSHFGAKLLKFESQATRKPLAKLRTGSDFGNNRTECTGLFADEDGVYCLLKEQGLHHGKLYALGQLVCYKYSGSTFTDKTKVGLNPAASTGDPIAFNAQYFSNPVGFIGYDEDNIYIADDGIDIQYVNENWRIIGNQNRIAAFNRKTNGMSFDDAGNATWFAEHSVYKKPNTKMLLWEKQSPAMVLSPMNYWISTDGTEAFSATNKLFEDSVQPTDVFCYDQDGNLYIILWKNPNYNVRRFALKEDGSYEKPGVDLVLTSSPVSAIVVDISNGQNSLYYACASGSYGQIQKKSWSLGSLFSSAYAVSGYSVSFNPNSAPVTALAANKDGLFVGTRTMSISPAGYTLSVKKYDKQDGADKGKIDVGAFQPTPTEHGSPYPLYTKIMSAINDLQILNGVLYAVTSKEECGMKHNGSNYKADTFKNSGKLYKIGSTKDGFSGSAVELAKKDPVGTAGNEVGYGFYRFIAVKYDEAERIRLIIASDGAWGKEGQAISPDHPYCKNADKVLEYDLKGSLQGEQNSGGSFSKTLQESGFEWN
ncbi:hypothetical protein [Treponema sp. Marseille-Q4130]|uniref:hypothetical protein n=1 Tax=Treponema sp. Marseille-Q4130 TaxID=2766702 RepID=UPI001652583C|nr:hypothetical protein [Treponema sp. Marseille-Q4130]MBC6720133.1 hypothetical protein [Treponema sp. Marseille-Q4130]